MPAHYSAPERILGPIATTDVAQCHYAARDHAARRIPDGEPTGSQRDEPSDRRVLTVYLALGFAALGVVLGAGILLCRPWWSARPATAPAYGLLAVAVTAHLSWVATWTHQVLGIAFSALVLLGAMLVLWHGRVWRHWRTVVPDLMLCAGIGAMSVGLAFLWGGAADPFQTTANRFREMPVDNRLQHLFADLLWNDESTTAMLGDWNGSDRPPLMSGVLLLIRPLGLFLGVPTDADVLHPANMQLAFALSVVSQLLWVPAAQCLLRCLRFSSGTTALTIVFCAVTPVVFHNTTYTWPKLMAAAFAVAALALLADVVLGASPARAAPFVAAVALTVFAFLSHGAVAFTAPLFLVLGIASLRRLPRRRRFAAVVLAGGAAVVAYLPWAAYGAIADPTTNRLLKWHLGGRMEPTDRSLTQVLVDAYTKTPVSDLLHHRWTNLRLILDPQLAGRWSNDPGWVARVREQDFFATGLALGLGALFLVGFLARTFVRVRDGQRPDPADRLRVVIVLASLLCILVWALLMFQEEGAAVHQGSYAWVLVLLAVPFASISCRSPALGVGAIAMSVLYAQLVYLTPTTALAGRLSHVALMTLLGGALVSGAAVRWASTDDLRDPGPAPRYRGRRRATHRVAP
jgi:hypothetical protein